MVSAISKAGPASRAIGLRANSARRPIIYAIWYYADADATPDDSAIIGQAHEVIERLAALREIGVEYVLLLASNAHTDGLRRFASDVMPALVDPAK